MRKFSLWLIAYCVLQLAVMTPVYSAVTAAPQNTPTASPVDRMQLVVKQILLLKNRYAQVENEWHTLKAQQDMQISRLVLEKTSKKLLDKATLSILVSQSDLQNLTTELNDAQQTISWLEKNIQEMQNQLNILNMFGLKVKHDELENIQRAYIDLKEKKQLLQAEKERLQYLQALQTLTANILQLKKEHYAHLSTQLRSYRLLNLKQQQMKNEFAYQTLQYEWLKQVSLLHTQINQVDPAQSASVYMQLEREIFYANENANLAYLQSLVARYNDQIQQLKIAVANTNSISILNAINDQASIIGKQVDVLNVMLKDQSDVLKFHIDDLSRKKTLTLATQQYIKRLILISQSYQTMQTEIHHLMSTLTQFRLLVEHALQVELSARQGLPLFGLSTLLDVGKEMLLVPTLTYHILKNLSMHLLRGIATSALLQWVLFVVFQSILIVLWIALKKLITYALSKPASWHGKINSRWISIQWIHHNFIEFLILGEIFFVMQHFHVALAYYALIIYLLLVWLIFKSALTILHVCLMEVNTAQTEHDQKLYHRLRGIILVGSIITALTVFLHQLPLIYELKMLCDRLFLLFLMAVAWLLLRSSRRIAEMILSHMETAHHPYVRTSIYLIWFLAPALVFVNALIGLCGYVNLIMTISGYEGLFLVVFMAYLIARGLLSDGMEHVSRLVIQHMKNGWLWTEAFLKPIDYILQIILFLLAGMALFVLYGWDKQSPIVTQLDKLLHYQLVHLLNTSITPLGMLELFIVIAVFYWFAKWTREFIYRLLLFKTKDMGIRNSLSILSQYLVVIVGLFICLRILGIDLRALTFVMTALAFGVGLGMRDLLNNFAAGFLILLERPIRVGDIVSFNGSEGKVTHIGGRAVTIRTWDYADLVVPNAEIFNKSFSNLTLQDNIARCMMTVKINRHDDPHQVQAIIYTVLAAHPNVLKEPASEVWLKQIDEMTMEFDIRFYVNIRLVASRVEIVSNVFMSIWDAFIQHNIEPPYPKHEVIVRN